MVIWKDVRCWGVGYFCVLELGCCWRHCCRDLIFRGGEVGQAGFIHDIAKSCVASIALPEELKNQATFILAPNLSAGLA